MLTMLTGYALLAVWFSAGYVFAALLHPRDGES